MTTDEVLDALGRYTKDSKESDRETVEYAGFDAVYIGGFATTASILGRPAVGLLTATEMIDHVRTIVEAVNLPVIADADTGYGNEINVIRTVREYEQAGVAAIHLEDQVSPKRCGRGQRFEMTRDRRAYKCNFHRKVVLARKESAFRKTCAHLSQLPYLSFKPAIE